MNKKLFIIFQESSASLSVFAFLLMGILLGSFNGNADISRSIAICSIIILLLVFRTLILIGQKNRNVLLKQFYQWLFESALIMAYSSFQQLNPVFFAVLLILSVLIMLYLFLIVFTKLIS
jgi:hypothetical protein